MVKLVAVTASRLDTAGIVHLSSSRTLRNFFAKIRQPDVGTEVLDQLCFSILPSMAAFFAAEFDHVTGMPREGK